MALRDRLRRLERAAEGPVVVIPQKDGPPMRFPQSQLAEAFLDGADRVRGRRGLAEDPDGAGEHPLSAAPRNSSDPRWRETFLVQDRPGAPIPDLSE